MIGYALVCHCQVANSDEILMSSLGIAPQGAFQFLVSDSDIFPVPRVNGNCWVYAFISKDDVKNAYILQSTIQPLTKKRDHGVGGVSDDYNTIFEVIWIGL